MNRKELKKKIQGFILVEKCCLLKIYKLQESPFALSSRFLEEAAAVVVEMRMRTASCAEHGAQPRHRPQPRGQLRFHTPLLPTLIFLTLFCLHLFDGVWVPAVRQSAPQGGMQNGARRCKRDAGAAAEQEDAGAGQVWLFFKEIPRSLRHFTYKTDPLHISYRK